MSDVAKTETKPLYLQLQEIIIQKIEAGEYLPGEMLLGERVLAELYGMNRMTVKSAVNGLVAKGYLYRIQGKGTFVQKKKFSKLDLGFVNESGNSGITALIKSQGIQVSNQVLGRGILPANNYFAGKLQIGREEAIYGLHRIRYGNGEPLAVEYSYVPLALFPDMDSINFKYVSLYDYMESKGHMPVIFCQRFWVIEPPEKEALHLELAAGEKVYYFEFIGKDQAGRVVEYTECYTRTDKAEFRFSATV